MSEELDFPDMRREMVEIITFHAMVVAEHTGTESLDLRVMAAMATVPRHEFVPFELRPVAYLDSPLPIGHGKTISQPFIVALMTDLLALTSHDSVLEVGTGSGYQSAVLAELAGQVYTVEIIDELAEQGRRTLQQLEYGNIQFRVGDGAQGWPDHAPFDKVIVTAAPEMIPASLIGQLKPGGRMVIPAGMPNAQTLILLEKDDTGHTSTQELIPVSFAPLITAH